jgi:hypothetical protein
VIEGIILPVCRHLKQLQNKRTLAALDLFLL